MELSEKVIADTQAAIRCKADTIAVRNGCYFDKSKAARMALFFTQFVRMRGRGGVKTVQFLKWQWEDVIIPLFCWRRADGRRRFKRTYISVGKKNGKTLLLALILLYVLVCEIGHGQECYSFATEKEQAAQIYREARKIVRASPELAALLHLTDTTKTIAFADNASFFRSMSAEADSADGLNIAFSVYDELHRAKNRELYDTIYYSGSAIEERTGEPALNINITTAGYDRESICYEVYSYAKRVRDGEIEDDSFYTYIREASVEDNWQEEATWHKANPSLGTPILPIEDFQRDFNEAKANPAGENRFRRLRLNQWTEQASRWIPLDVWDKNSGTIDPDKYKGRECWAGLDLSSSNDTTVFVLAFPNERGGFDLLPHFWIPADNVEKRSVINGVNYSAWVRSGHLFTTPGNVIDYEPIGQKIIELGKTYKIQEIAFDSWNAVQLTQQLSEQGFTMVETRQGFSLSPPAKELFRLLQKGAVNHGNHPVLRWQAGNVEARYDQHENIKLEKPGGKDSRLKIDGIVATVMAIDRAMRHGPAVKKTSGLQIAFI